MSESGHGLKFCPRCGEGLARRACAACGTLLLSEAKHCHECGAEVEGQPHGWHELVRQVEALKRQVATLASDAEGLREITQRKSGRMKQRKELSEQALGSAKGSVDGGDDDVPF
ncbi:MAG: hypothetical protein JXX28_11530 [Deltaproteobacteria bacterium]|nr:hypothetical protein [Deltaproteobacteria bacterium]